MATQGGFIVRVLRGTLARPTLFVRLCVALGAVAHGNVHAATERPDIPAFADGIYIENAGGLLTYFYTSPEEGLAAGLQIRCDSPASWGLVGPSACKITGAQEQISYLGTSVKAKSRYLITANYVSGTKPAVYTSYMGAVARSCPTGYALKGSISYYANRDKAAAGEYVSCVWMPTKPSGQFLGRPSMPADADGQCQAETSLVGNPIDAATANKLEIVTDFTGGSSSGLIWQRTYNSGAFSPGLSGIYTGVVPTTTRLGARWRGNFDRFLVPVKLYDPDAGADVDALALEAEDGKSSTFRLAGERYLADDASGAFIDVDETAGGAWAYHAADGSLERYDAAGNLRQQQGRNGLITTLAYASVDLADGTTDSRLTAVTDPQGRTLSFHYDAVGRISSVGLPDGGVVSYEYNEAVTAGRDADLARVTQADGSTVSYLYDETAKAPGAPGRHLLTGIVGSDGKRFASFTYDTYGRAASSEHAGGAGKVTVGTASSGVRTMRDAMGNSTIYTFAQVAGTPRLVSRKQPAGAGCPAAASGYTYSDLGQVLSRTGVDGTITTFAYDPVRHLEIERVDAAGTAQARTTRTQWDTRFPLPVLIERTGRTESFRYDDRGNLLERVVSAKDSDSTGDGASTRTHRFAYDADSRLTLIEGPRAGDALRLTYFTQDAPGCAAGGACPWRKGDLETIDDSLGRRFQALAYDGAGRMQTSQDANGLVTHTTFDSMGRPVSVALYRDPADPVLATTRLGYDAVGNLASTIDADGVALDYRYDDARRLIAIQDGAGNRIDYTLDARGLVTGQTTTDAAGQLRYRLTRVFDALGRVQQVTDAAGQRTTFTYDAAGRPTSITDPLSRRSTASYDALGRVAQRIQDSTGIAASTTLAYNSNDDVSAITDPKGLVTGYSRSGLGNLEALVSPDTGQTLYQTDAAGKVVRSQTADGHVGQMTYDARERLTQIRYDSETPTTYGWDAASAACPDHERFALDRLASMEDGSGRTEYCYDELGRVTRKLQRSGDTSLALGYAYTAAGRLAAMTLPDGSRVSFTRDARGRVTAVAVDTATSSLDILHGASWAPFGPVTSWIDGGGQSLQRTYGTDGRLSALTDSAPGGLNLKYTYDARGNLSQVAGGGSTSVWRYDGIGRLIDAQLNFKVTHAYLWDATGNRLRYTGPAGSVDYTYPSDSHRLLALGADERRYDAAGHTTATASRQFTYNAQGRLTGVHVGVLALAHYAYNGRGERVLRTDDAGTTVTLYDEAGHWIGDYNEKGEAKQQVIWLDDLPVAVLVGGKVYDIRPDHLGTPRAVIDRATQRVVWSWSAHGEAFGQDAPAEDPDGDGVPFVFDMRFPGQRYDAATGMNYNYFRDYDPRSGRYVQSDPMGLNGGLSTYAYVGGNPLSFIDPFGLEQGIAFHAIFLADGGIPQTSGLGNHYYNLWIPLCAGDCTPADAFNAMKNFSAPGALPAQGGTRDLMLLGLISGNPITQTVDPCKMTITNVTKPGHLFDGSVNISIQTRNGVVGAQVVGTGLGPNPVMNQLMGPVIFEGLGFGARESLGGSGL